ncbi:telomerase Cajal body protein 1-like isoform X2 [Watersipora subatra]|uniref:telomerase Cajal body protein 1-like isoform X2 n=1 Tax=Watersipora subatra TaxID=2589382 RepID=UPI00355C6033
MELSESTECPTQEMVTERAQCTGGLTQEMVAERAQFTDGLTQEMVKERAPLTKEPTQEMVIEKTQFTEGPTHEMVTEGVQLTEGITHEMDTEKVQLTDTLTLERVTDGAQLTTDAYQQVTIDSLSNREELSLQPNEKLAGDGDLETVETPSFSIYNLSRDTQPYQLAFARVEFEGHFLKGAKWSRDGTQLLSCSDDRKMRIFNLPSQFYTGDFSEAIPEMVVLLCLEGGTIYDYSWYPLMDSSMQDSCCFITTSQHAPIHLWDSISSQLVSTYSIINHLDEIDVAYSLSFSPDGCLIYAGSTKQISVFDVSQPGRQIENVKTHKRRSTGQIGIISCFDFLPAEQLFAAGSYSKSVGVYDQRNNEASMILEGHTGGVTQIKFSADGNCLYSGARKDGELLVWDMRSPGQILAILERDVRTNQRIYFDLDPSARYMCSGNHNGTVNIWDLAEIDCSTSESEQQIECKLNFTASSDCVNSVCFHPTLAMLASCSGQRSHHLNEAESDESEEDSVSIPDNSIRLWWLGA